MIGQKWLRLCLAALCLCGLVCVSAMAETPETFRLRAELIQEGALPDMSADGEVGLMSDDGRLYQLIYLGMLEHSDIIDIRTLQLTDVEQLRETYARVINDHPRLFYVEGSVEYWTSLNQITTLRVTYKDDIYGSEELAAFDRRVDEILAETVFPGMSKLDQALALHDYLVLHCAYNREVAETGTTTDAQVHNAYGALIAGDAVCDGYALGYKALLDELEIPSSVVTSRQMAHAWNIIALNGNWYHVDATWDDPVPDTPGMSRHTYFLRSDEELKNPPSGIQMSPHTAWTAQASCVDTTYSAGWAFRESNYSFYWRNEGFYYLDGNDNVKHGNLEMSNATFVIEGLERAFYSGVQWRDGMIYYIKPLGGYTSAGKPEPCAIVCRSLTDNKIFLLGDFTFQRTWQGSSTGDGLGIYCSMDGMKVEAYSSEQYKTVASADLLPAEWMAAADGTTAPLGVKKENQNLKIGVYLAEEIPKDARIYAAWYQGQRMYAVSCAEVSRLRGTQWITVPLQGGDADGLRVFMLSGDAGLTPICAAGCWTLDSTMQSVDGWAIVDGSGDAS